MLREGFVEDAAWKTAGESVPKTRQTGSLSRGTDAAPSGKDTLDRRVPRTQKSNVEIERKGNNKGRRRTRQPLLLNLILNL